MIVVRPALLVSCFLPLIVLLVVPAKGQFKETYEPPDYVFEPDYDLMPLSDLRSFIQREKKLPDIPSAKQVQQRGGHNMTELQLKLLQKIEELTLYTLEQDRRLSRKDLEVEGLKQENTRIKAELARIQAVVFDR